MVTEYEYRVDIIERGATPPSDDSEGGPTVEIPEDAIGVTLKTFAEDVWVRYLVPVRGGRG